MGGEWRFRTDPQGVGESQGWARSMPADAESVDVPHTWGVGRHAEYEGVAWYWREVALPASLSGKRLELHFGATSYKARLFVNGQAIADHEGGHTAWFADVTRALDQGGLVAVRVDNRPGLDTLPGWAMRLEGSGNVWYDWWHYGGLVREVALVAQERALIRRQAIRSRIDGGGARVTTRVVVEGAGPVRLQGRILGPAGEPVRSAAAELTLQGRGEATLEFAVTRPRLWHFDQPNLYSLELTLAEPGGAVLDRKRDSFGIRTIEIRDRGLWLNGERVRLSGMTRHEDSPQEGLAETRGTMQYDWDDMKRLQVVFTRPVHYPQHPFILDYADRNGVLLVPEIPMWQFSQAQMKDPKVLALARRMMQEMIEQHGNHPSILAWSVCNESDTSTPGGVAYVRAMVEHVKALDPDRFVSYADDGLGFLSEAGTNANQHTDFLMMNTYFGSWHGPAERLAPALERVGRLFPEKMLVVSEFGLAGPFGPDAAQTDARRVRIVEDQLREFARHDFVAGAMLWCYQDYKSHRNLRPGPTSGYVDHGLVDENRQRRPSYEVWRELTSPVLLSLAFRWGQGNRPVGFEATVARRPPTDLPSYDLRGYRLEWEARDFEGTLLGSGGEALPVIGEPRTVTASWAAGPSRAVTVSVRVIRPTGFVAAERSERWWESRTGGLTLEEAKKQGLPHP